MRGQSVSNSQRSRSDERIDQFGMLFWKIGVLVIGLHCALVLAAQPVVPPFLAQIVTLLLSMALGLLALGTLRILWLTAAWGLKRRAGGAAPALRYVWRGWVKGDWFFTLGIDCALAAGIIPLSVLLAAEDRLDWGGVGWLAIVATLRVMVHEIRRAVDGPAR